MSLLDFPDPLSPDERSVPDSWRDSRIDAVAIRDLKAIIPPVSGKALLRPNRGQQERPDASDGQKSLGTERKAPRERPAF